MRKRQYHVELTPEQEERLRAIGYTGTHKVYQVVHARLLLKAAAGDSDRDIAECLEVGLSTVARLRKLFCTKGLEACLARKEQQCRFRKVTGDIEARIAKIACEKPPGGASRWTLDLITEGLSPLSPQKVAFAAGRLLLERIEVCVAAGEPFAFESTLSGKAYARHIPRWQQAGYDVVLYYLRLASADIAVNRVKQRVEQGGHHVPEPDIRRRFVRSWENFQQVYRPMVDAWTLLDMTGSNPVIMEQST